MLHHVAVEVNPEVVPACVAFYETLGFEPVEAPESLRDRATWLERDGTQIHLLFAEEPETLRQGHLAVVVEDFERAMTALRADGHEPERRRQHWDSPRGVVRDPAGNLVELMAFPP